MASYPKRIAIDIIGSPTSCRQLWPAGCWRSDGQRFIYNHVFDRMIKKSITILRKGFHLQPGEIARQRQDVMHVHEKKSFSQSGEDLIIDFIFRLRGIPCPTFLDIGAHHPWYINNTAIFYQRGARGVNIEPNFELFQIFQQERREDCNLNIGIAEHAGEMDFYLMSVPTLNTFSKAEAERYVHELGYKLVDIKKTKVDTVTNIIETHCQNIFPDLLNVDAEGVDELILNSIDYEKNCPKVICVETLSFSNTGAGVKNAQIIEFLRSKGYMAYADTHINTIFVKMDFWKRSQEQ